MSSPSCVFDASALLAITNAEIGADVALMHLDGATMSSVNASEVVRALIRKGDDPKAAVEDFSTYEIEIVAFDQSQAMKAALLDSITGPFGLSLGDRACMTLAQTLRVPVVTADRIWQRIPLDQDIIQIR